MNIFFGTKIPIFSNILGIVGTVVMPPVVNLLILLRLCHNLKSRRIFILNGFNQNSTNKWSVSIYRYTFKCIYFSLVVFHCSVYYCCLYVYNFSTTTSQLVEVSSSYAQNYLNTHKQQVTIKEGNIH